MESSENAARAANNPAEVLLFNLMGQMVEESQKTAELFRNQTVINTQLSRVLEKQAKALDLANRKTEQEFRRVDQRCEKIESTIDVRCNTLEYLFRSLLYEHQQKHIKDTRDLQNQMNALRAGGGGANVNNNNLVPEAGAAAVGAQAHGHTRGAYTLGLKNQANQKIQDIMERDHVPAEVAILQIASMDQFAGIDRQNLRIWWDQKDRIRDYLIRNPGHAGRRRMLR